MKEKIISDIKKGLTLVLVFVFLLVSGCSKEVDQHKVLLSDMYQYLSSLKTRPLKLNELKDLYTPNVVMIINGELVARGYQSFFQHFKFMLKKTRNYKFTFPRQSMIGEGDRVAVKYNISFMTGGKISILHVIALFTFYHNKISRWDEVVSKDSPHAQGLTKEK